MKKHKHLFMFAVLLLTIVQSCTKAVKNTDRAGQNSDTAKIIRRLDTLVQKMNEAASRRETIEAMRYCEEGLALELELPDDKKAYGDLHSRFGAMLESAGMYSFAREHFRLAISGAMKKTPPDYGVRYYKNARMAALLQRTNENDSAAFYLRRAIAEAKNQPDKLWEASGYNNYAFLKEGINQLDSASYFYDRAENVLSLKNGTDSMLLGSIRDNKAHVLLLRKNYSGAMAAYRANEKQYQLMSNESGQIKSLLNAADVFSASGKNAEALQLTDSVNVAFPDAIKKSSGMRQRWLNMRYSQLLKLGREQEALGTLQQVMAIKDSIMQEEKRMSEKSMSTAAAGELERHQRENEIGKLKVQQAEAKTQLSWFIGVTVAFTSLLFVVLLVLVSRKRSAEQQNKIKLAESEIRNKKLEGEKLQQELELKKRDLTDMVLFNRHKKEIIEELILELQDAAKAEDSGIRLKKMIQELRARSMATESLDLVGENIEAVNTAFFDKLEKQFPDLSKGERALCGLLRMNLTTKDIAQLRKVEPDSIKMAKKRLRRKLGLEPETDLYLFMQKL